VDLADDSSGMGRSQRRSHCYGFRPEIPIARRDQTELNRARPGAVDRIDLAPLQGPQEIGLDVELALLSR